MIIYKITNKINGKAYIGQTIYTLEKRWREHMRANSYCRALKFAINAYGVESFSKEILSICDSKEQLNAAEEYFIDHYQTFGQGGYNLNAGGDSKLASDETKQRQSVANKGKSKNFSPEMIKKLSEQQSARRKGKAPWNKGLKGSQVAWNKGLPNTWYRSSKAAA